jgi:O-antigen ligase
MKYALFAILLFGLPHTMWFYNKFSLEPDQVPLGVLNLLFIVGAILWTAKIFDSNGLSNPFTSYTWFIALNLVGVFVALFTAYETPALTFSLAKNQIGLLLLYFIPLAAIKTKKDFSVFYMISIFILMLISIEVIRSGILAGPNYNDNKRGSGPFSYGFYGSDVAGSFLAQIMMFVTAFVLSKDVSKYIRILMSAASLVVLFAIYATYARGALVGAIVGLIFMLGIIGLKPRHVLLLLIAVGLGVYVAPQSITARLDNTRTESGEYDQSTQGRLSYYVAGLEVLKENPLGVGTGQARAAMKRAIGKYVDPHNGFIYTAMELGIPGLISLLVLLAILYLEARRLYKDETLPSIYRTYLIGCGGLIGALIGCNMFYANFYKDLVMGSIMIHFGMLAYIRSESTTHPVLNTPAP